MKIASFGGGGGGGGGRNTHVLTHLFHNSGYRLDSIMI